MKDCIPLHEQVRLKRRELDIKQEFLAELSGVSQSAISRFEAGTTDIRATAFIKIQKALNFKDWI